MDLYTLPATTYVPPPRLARKHVLNTIIEDERGEKDEGSCTEEERGDAARGRSRYLLAPRSVQSTSPVPSLTSSTSSYPRSDQCSRDFDELYDVSDDDSVHDSELTPSIRFQDMSTRSTSPNESICSGKRRNRYPSLIIPSPGSWPTIEKLKTPRLLFHLKFRCRQLSCPCFHKIYLRQVSHHHSFPVSYQTSRQHQPLRLHLNPNMRVVTIHGVRWK